MDRHTTISISAGSVIKVILILIMFYLAFVLRDVILIFVSGVVIASAVEPLVQWFTDRKINRVVAVVVLYLIIIGLLFVSFYFLFVPLLQEVSTFLATLPDYVASAELWKPLQSIGISAGSAVENFSSHLSLGELAARLNKTVSNTGSIWGTFSAIFGGVFSLILVLVISFYLAVQEKGIENFLRTTVPLKQRSYVISLWNRAEKKIGLWMQGQIVLVVIIAVLVYLALTLLQVPNALLLAVFAGLLELIPVFGPIIAAIPAIAISGIDGGVTQALMVAGAYLVIQQFENHLIYPVVVKKVVGVSPIMVILALIAGANLAGFLGILLSVPVAAVLVELFHDIGKGKIDVSEEK